MDKPITIHGARGSGSVPVEAALTLIGLPYAVIERAPLREVAADEAAYRINPMRQAPALAGFWAERFPFNEGWEG